MFRLGCVRIVILTLTLLASLPTPVSKAQVVDEYGFTYESIGEALENTAPYTTIYVYKGVYEGGLEVRKPVKLVGIDYPILDGGLRGSVIKIIDTSDVYIEGFEIVRSGRVYSTEDAGVRIDSSNNVTIRNNVFRDIFFGILVKNSSYIYIYGNEITGIPEYYISDRMHGIYNWYSRNVFIVNNTFYHVKDGVYNDHNYYTVIDNNRFFYGRYGIHLMYSDNFKITNNSITGFIAGMAIMYSENITVRYNLITGNRVGGVGEGLFIPETDNILVEYNWIVGNIVGINIRYTPYTPGKFSIIRFNVVAFNYIGVNVDTDSEAYVYGNDFIENIQDIRYIGYTESRIRWYNESLKMGNFWSGYVAYDSDNDSIYDIPFISIDPLYTFIQEHRELSIYYFTPVYELLDIIFKYSFESRLEGLIEDRYPFKKPVNIEDIGFKIYLENIPYPVALTLPTVYLLHRGGLNARGGRRK